MSESAILVGEKGDKPTALGGVMHLTGEVSSGLGRAHIFMAQPHYQEQFRVVLGATAWPGTLNLKVSDESLAIYLALREASGIETQGISSDIWDAAGQIDTTAVVSHRIVGFEREGRSFGGATAFVATINLPNGHPASEVKCAILIPDLTRHTDVVEVIAPIFLREAFDIVDGDALSISCGSPS